MKIKQLLSFFFTLWRYMLPIQFQPSPLLSPAVWFEIMKMSVITIKKKISAHVQRQLLQQSDIFINSPGGHLWDEAKVFPPKNRECLTIDWSLITNLLHLYFLQSGNNNMKKILTQFKAIICKIVLSNDWLMTTQYICNNIF